MQRLAQSAFDAVAHVRVTQLAANRKNNLKRWINIGAAFEPQHEILAERFAATLKEMVYTFFEFETGEIVRTVKDSWCRRRQLSLNYIPTAALVRYCEFPTAFLAAATQNVTTCGSLVARAKTVCAVAFFVCGLPCPFHVSKFAARDRV
jgi:hypothetical protein